jgi:hypothetical protein
MLQLLINLFVGLGAIADVPFLIPGIVLFGLFCLGNLLGPVLSLNSTAILGMLLACLEVP